MMQLSRQERLIKLESITNTRDLGGYETQDSHYTRTKKYIRAASPANLTSEDCQMLFEYGVRCVVDLRSEYELTQQPSALKEVEGIDYYPIAIMQEKNITVIPEDIKNYQDLSGFYIYLIESNKAKFKEVFKTFLKYPYDTVLFNCSAGKDRTGVVAALLLDLAGCYEYDMVKDYAESYENNMPMLSELEKMVTKENQAFLGSNPNYMIKFISYLVEKYGSAKNYLLDCGLKEEEIEEIIENFKI